MSTPYLAEITIFAFAFAPKGWAMASGQLLPINQNQALFALLGTTYGGNGVTNFALPNLQGAMPMHVSGAFPLGQKAGEASHTLVTTEIPSHTHIAMASSNAGDQSAPANNLWADGTDAYNTVSDVTMNVNAIAAAGGGQPHNNTPPYLVLNFAIALQGIFPSRN
jgi:microcystin-dependent protein